MTSSANKTWKGYLKKRIEEENQNGRYQVIIDSKGDQYWYDTRYGDKIAIGSKSYGYILLKEEGGMKKRFDKEFELVQALKEIE